MKRRNFLKSASLLGATLAFGLGEARASAREWRERRDLYPEGVASGDPHPDSVLLWTRRPPVNGDAAKPVAPPSTPQSLAQEGCGCPPTNNGSGDDGGGEAPKNPDGKS